MSRVQAVPRCAMDVREPSISIVPMRTEHIDDVVRVYLDSFPGFFLTFLGSRFLRVIYSEILKTPDDHLVFVAQDSSGTLVGFVIGVLRQSDFYARLARQCWFGCAVASLGAVIRRPRIIPRLFRALRYSKTSQAAAVQAVLMGIAVVPEMEGCGIGQRLATHFLMAMKQKNIDSVSLVSDRDANDRANRFYRRLGFQIARTYVTPEGRWMNEYVIHLTTWSLPSSLHCL
jgi:ribosomal protein S18 acetylase RimI-like enzyme